MDFRQPFDFGKIQHHAIAGVPFLLKRIPFQRDMQYITVPVQVSALAVVIRNAVSGIEFEFSGNRQHENIRVSVNICAFANRVSISGSPNRLLSLF